PARDPGLDAVEHEVGNTEQESTAENNGLGIEDADQVRDYHRGVVGGALERSERVEVSCACREHDLVAVLETGAPCHAGPRGFCFPATGLRVRGAPLGIECEPTGRAGNPSCAGHHASVTEDHDPNARADPREED